MGQFSWFRQDDGSQIVDGKEDLTIMTDDKGNQYVENCYEGYGVFGGKDFYVLLAEMNGLSAEDFTGRSTDPEFLLRVAGINMAFDGSPNGTNPNVIFPSLSRNGLYYDGIAPEPDPNQGWEPYYDDEDDYYDEDDDW